MAKVIQVANSDDRIWTQVCVPTSSITHKHVWSISPAVSLEEVSVQSRRSPGDQWSSLPLCISLRFLYFKQFYFHFLLSLLKNNWDVATVGIVSIYKHWERVCISKVHCGWAHRRPVAKLNPCLHPMIVILSISQFSKDWGFWLSQMSPEAF